MTFEKFLEFVAECSKILSSGVIGALFGYFCKTQIDHRLAISRIYITSEVTETNKAIASFRAAFAPQLAFLYLAKQKGNIREIVETSAFLRDSLLKVAAEVELFRHFVPKSKRSEYQKAWENYRKWVADYGFSAAELGNMTGDSRKTYEAFEQMIHEILRFSEDMA